MKHTGSRGRGQEGLLHLRDVSLGRGRGEKRENWRPSPLQPTALGAPAPVPPVTGPGPFSRGSLRAVPTEGEGQVPWMPAWPWGPAQKADKPLLPGWLPCPPFPRLPVCTQPAQQEAGCGPGQLVSVTVLNAQHAWGPEA